MSGVIYSAEIGNRGDEPADVDALGAEQSMIALLKGLLLEMRLSQEGGLGAGTQTIGGTLDAGPAWVCSQGVLGKSVSSANASSTPLVITDSPGAGKKIVLHDLIFSTDTAMTVTLRDTTTQNTLGTYYVPANYVGQITPRSTLKALAAGRTLELLASTSGNIAAMALYHSEP